MNAPLPRESGPTSARQSCICERCVSCCERKPGYFKPGEAEKVAAYLGLSLAELFRDYLAVDWTLFDPSTFLLTPGIVGLATGEEFPADDDAGRCVFLTPENRCRIHAVKPFECATAWCGDGPVDYDDAAFVQAIMEWRAPEHQAQIAALLGREPDNCRAAAVPPTPGGRDHG